ncbi:BrnA antitoxin family protein (plasmid) [Cupriavidus sp. P-10]|uniref:BrnA antitoxin family protein n=1 Tax=Cupriavidus sp. P-10 TaxID=2027911 RepID=UPI001F3DBDF1|nr:BrnA antitoxin family protein [Cupriavidus sp. P-10]BDB29285.1 BrnA antitoxin family protein [Cupriavidus sp. P-10]
MLAVRDRLDGQGIRNHADWQVGVLQKLNRVATCRRKHHGANSRLEFVRGAQKAPRKVALSLRIQPEILAAFQASGPGWQQRINAALAHWLRTHAPAELAGNPGSRLSPDRENS